MLEDRHCGRGVPVDPAGGRRAAAAGADRDALPTAAARGLSITQDLFTLSRSPAPGARPAPPCKQQGPFTFQGETSTLPARQAAPLTRTYPRARESAVRAGRGGRRAATGRVLAAVALAGGDRRRCSRCGLEPSAATDTLVGRARTPSEATERYRENFGDDAVVMLVRGRCRTSC